MFCALIMIMIMSDREGTTYSGADPSNNKMQYNEIQ